MANILIMEPDERISAHIYQLLTQAGHQCYAAGLIYSALRKMAASFSRTAIAYIP